MVRTTLGIRYQQRPRLVDAVAPLRDVVAVQSAVRLVLGILLHQLALATHRLLAVLPRVVQVRQVQTDGNSRCHHTGAKSLCQVLILLLAQTVNAERNDHRQDDEQIVVRHLYVVRQHLEGTEDGSDEHAPEVFTPEGQHHTGNHRRQVRQRHHLPDVSGGNDDEEVAGERPHDGPQCRQILTEVEGTQQDVEAQQVGKDIPHVLGQPQVIPRRGLRQQLRRVVRRRQLIRRHTAKQRIGPARALAGTLVILHCLLTGTSPSRRVVTVEHPALNVGREEVGKRNRHKQDDHQYVGQPNFPVLHHNYFLISVCKVNHFFSNSQELTKEKQRFSW